MAVSNFGHRFFLSIISVFLYFCVFQMSYFCNSLIHQILAMKMYHTFIKIITLSLLLFSISCDEASPQKITNNHATTIQKTGNPAVDGLSAKITNAPNDATLYAARAGAWLELEGFDQAIEDLQKAISIDSLKPEYHHVLADIYMDYYKSRLALLTLEKAAIIFPKGIPTLLKLTEFQWILKQYDDALFTLERIRGIDPTNAEMFFMFGNIYRDKEDIAKSKANYQKAVENDPDLLDAWVSLGYILADEKNPLAEKYIDNALRVDSNNVAALHAKAYYLSNHKNDLEGSIKYFKKINIVNPQYEDGYYNLGLVYLDAGRVEEAWESFNLAIQIAPTFVEAYYYRGIASKMKGDKAAAKSDLQQALNLQPEFQRARDELETL